MPKAAGSGRALRRGWIGCVVLAMLASALVISGGNAAAAAPAPTRLHTSGSQILDAANKPVRIRAVNWFGMETSNCAPHGLWTISLDAGMAQIAGFGFNTIRLPFSNQCIDQTAPVSGIDVTRNPTLQNKTPLQIMDAVIASAKAHGLQVILDQHRPDSGSQSELWYTPAYPESKWIADWVTLAKRYANNPAVIGADLHNEPHASACWGCGDPARDWAAAATRAGNAVLAADPKLLILVEGIEQQGNGSSTWWGGGLSDAAAHPISLAVAHQLVYSPHDYPASIYNQTWFSAPNYPANLPGVWDRNWGYLQKNNIAPVLLGEFGTKLETTSDQKWLQSMVGYLNATGMSFAYWSFNPNSGDTGGLVKDDWTTPQTAKLAALKPLFAPGTAVVASPVTPRPTKPTKPTTPPKPTTVRPSPAGAAVQATWTLQSAWNAGYVADFMVTAKSKVSTWTVSWPDAGATSVVNAWGLRCTVGGGRITCRSAGWATAIGGGGSVRVGLQVAGNGRAPSNPAISIS